MSKRRTIERLAIVATTACTVTGAALQAGTAEAATQPEAATSGWHVITTVGSLPGVTSAGDLAVTGRTNAWSTWDMCSPCAGQNQATAVQVDRWNGSAWRQVPIPQRLGNYGTDSVGLGASSSRDAWLFDTSPLLGKALHWNGNRWAVRDIPRWVVRGNLSGTVALTIADFGRAGMWVFSEGQESFSRLVPFAARYQHGRWAKARLPGIPIQVSAVSPTDIWALADPASLPRNPHPFLMHWNGKRWSTTAIPAPSKIPPKSVEFVRDLVAAGPNDVWLQRDIETGTQGARTLYLLHWNGKAWHRLPLRKPTSGVVEMARDGHGGLWLVTNGPGPAFRWFFDHMNGGRWTRTLVPGTAKTTVQEVTRLAWIPGTRSEWAAGGLLPVNSNVDVLGGIWKFRS
jgi:hypothetical protein